MEITMVGGHQGNDTDHDIGVHSVKLYQGDTLLDTFGLGNSLTDPWDVTTVYSHSWTETYEQPGGDEFMCGF